MTPPPQSLPVPLGDKAHGRPKESILALYSAQSYQLPTLWYLDLELTSDAPTAGMFTLQQSVVAVWPECVAFEMVSTLADWQIVDCCSWV